MNSTLRILFVLATTLTAFGQGTVNFNNKVTASGINAPVTDATGAVLGRDYLAQLYAGATPDSLTPVGSAVVISLNHPPTGYFQGGTRQIDFLSPIVGGWFQVRAWAARNGASYVTAVASDGTVGFSNIFHLGILGDPNAPLETLPVDLVGLQPFSVHAVPEPGTLVLGFLGVAALTLRVQRNKPRAGQLVRRLPA